MNNSIITLAVLAILAIIAAVFLKSKRREKKRVLILGAILQSIRDDPLQAKKIEVKETGQSFGVVPGCLINKLLEISCEKTRGNEVWIMLTAEDLEISFWFRNNGIYSWVWNSHHGRPPKRGDVSFNLANEILAEIHKALKA